MATVGVPVSRIKAFEIIQAEKNRPCTDCGRRFNYWIMQFDHVKGKKKFNISRVGRHIKVTKRQLINEIRKCQVVCANCHHERTYKSFKSEKVKMKMTVLRTEMRRANKEHKCLECSGIINYLEQYAALIGNFDGKFSTVHLHNGCEDKFIKKNHSQDTIEQGPVKILPDPKEEECMFKPEIYDNPKTTKGFESFAKPLDLSQDINHVMWSAMNPTTKTLSASVNPTNAVPMTIPSLEGVQFKALLESLTHFHQRWQVEHSNSLDDRLNLLDEENREWVKAVKDKSNVLEELADQLGVVLGNILWSNIKVDSSISVYGVMKYLEEKLRKRAKYGYKMQNIATGVTKMTHWEKALKFLETDRVNWRVLSGPRFIHPEIREFLTFNEIELLEKTGA